MLDKQLTPHFKLSEFACHCGCGASNINMDLVTKVEQLRVALNRPITITSGVRCQKYNDTLKDSVSDSAHVKGLAVDIGVSSGGDRFEIVTQMLKLGFSRFGVANGFIHVDMDTSKPQSVIWKY